MSAEDMDSRDPRWDRMGAAGIWIATLLLSPAAAFALVVALRRPDPSGVGILALLALAAAGVLCLDGW